MLCTDRRRKVGTHKQNRNLAKSTVNLHARARRLTCVHVTNMRCCQGTYKSRWPLRVLRHLTGSRASLPPSAQCVYICRSLSSPAAMFRAAVVCVRRVRAPFNFYFSSFFFFFFFLHVLLSVCLLGMHSPSHLGAIAPLPRAPPPPPHPSSCLQRIRSGLT